MVAALALVLLFFLLATAIATAQERLVDDLKAGTQQVKRWGGYILLAVGSWFLILAIWADAFSGVFPV